MYLSDPMPQVAEMPKGPEQTESEQAPGTADGNAQMAEEVQASTAEVAERPKAEANAPDTLDQPDDSSTQTSGDEISREQADKLVAEAAPDAPAESENKGQSLEEKESPLSQADNQAAPEPETLDDQAKSGATESDETPAPPASEKQPDVATDTVEAQGGSTAETTNPEPKVAAKPEVETAQAPKEEKQATSQSLQQTALPRVIAPDHNSLPQWQRNRQRIDRRWLKDSAGNPKPRVAFILSELGLAPKAAEEIIKKLPPAITLSFSPYARPQTLEYLSALARSNGHEVMLDLPLEPIDFPQRDPGPKALLTALEPKENLERLDWSLGRSTGYVGVAVWMGSRFVGSPRQMQPLMEAIESRGLVYLDNAEREDSLGPDLATNLGIPAVTSHRYVDVPLASRDAIDARLAQVERIALQFGSAVAMGRPFPVTVERLAEWSAELEKRGIILVPITVLAEDAVRRQNLAAKPSEKKDKSQNNAEGSQNSGTKTQ